MDQEEAEFNAIAANASEIRTCLKRMMPHVNSVKDKATKRGLSVAVGDIEDAIERIEKLAPD